MSYNPLRNLLLQYDNQKMPSYSFIGRELGMTRQTATKKVSELEEAGLIEISEDRILTVLFNKQSKSMIFLKDWYEQLKSNPFNLSEQEIAYVLYIAAYYCFTGESLDIVDVFGEEYRHLSGVLVMIRALIKTELEKE